MRPLARLADLAHRRRGLMIAAWIALLLAVGAGGSALAGDYDADYSTPGSESAAAAALLDDHFPSTSDETIDVVWQAPGGVDDVQPRMDAFLERAERLEGIGDAGQTRVGPDGTIAMASLDLDRAAWDVPLETGERLIGMAEEQSGDGLRIELGGGPIAEAQGGASPEAAGLLAAAVILLVAFGSIVAAGLPIVTALFGLGISASLVGVLAAVMDVPEWAPAVASLIGIGVGIDYALLVLTRFRVALHAGSSRRDAIVESVTTAGRSVVVAGTIVMISLFGLFVTGASYMRGVAVAAAIAVLVVMVAAVTLLPALLALLGPRVDRLRIPGLGGAIHAERTTLASRWSGVVQRRPWTAALAGAAVLLALAAPVLGLRLGFPDAGNDPDGTTTRGAYELITDAFGPGANGPLLVAVDVPASGPGGELEQGVARLRDTPGVAQVVGPRISPDGEAAMLLVQPTTAPQSPATEDLVHRLRDEVLPATGLDAHVGGITAAFVDQSEQLAGRLALFVAAVVGLAFLLLVAAFRAPVVALKAGVMNLLSVAAAYGVVALVAEGGFAGSLIGIDTDTPVPPFIPVMMFAILFGLSMDYEVFLLSRVREEYLAHGDPARAVTAGLAKTARVITAAAAIMVTVFLAFVLSPETFLKLMGVGMAAAILVDATIVRMVLVPAVMQLLGRANWWAPRWLDRALPRVALEQR